MSAVYARACTLRGTTVAHPMEYRAANIPFMLAT